MTAASSPTFATAAAAAFDWWRLAGVDGDLRDDPRDWLAKAAEPESTAPVLPEVPPPPPPMAAAERFAAPDPAALVDAGQMPASLGEFTAWWLSEPSLDHGMVMDRVSPRGNAGAALMVLVAEPEDGDAERLLSGPQGQMLDAMLGAMGVAPDAVYVASALPRRTPAADWAGIAAAGMGAVVRRHVALVAPKRLICCGGNILPLLGNDWPNSGESLQRFNHEGHNLPLLTAPDLQSLLARPRARAGFWQRWLDWTGNEAV